MIFFDNYYARPPGETLHTKSVYVGNNPVVCISLRLQSQSYTNNDIYYGEQRKMFKIEKPIKKLTILLVEISKIEIRVYNY